MNVLQKSLSKISFTSDIWSRANLEPYMALTAHYLVQEGDCITLRCHLIAFRVLHGSHTGVRMADLCMEIFDQYKITEKVRQFRYLGHVCIEFIVL